MPISERVARTWHEGSDHATDGTPFGGPLCNCWRAAGRLMPMLRDAWWDGWSAQDPDEHAPNPYLEGRHVDQ